MTSITTIEETFGLIAVEAYGGKVRLWTEAELWPWIDQEVSVGRSLGRPEAEIRTNIIVSRYGDAGLRLYFKAVDIGTDKVQREPVLARMLLKR